MISSHQATGWDDWRHSGRHSADSAVNVAAAAELIASERLRRPPQACRAYEMLANAPSPDPGHTALDRNKIIGMVKAGDSLPRFRDKASTNHSVIVTLCCTSLSQTLGGNYSTRQQRSTYQRYGHRLYYIMPQHGEITDAIRGAKTQSNTSVLLLLLLLLLWRNVSLTRDSSSVLLAMSLRMPASLSSSDALCRLMASLYLWHIYYDIERMGI